MEARGRAEWSALEQVHLEARPVHVPDARGLRAQQAVDALAATAAASVMHVSGNPGARASHGLIGVGQELWRLRGVQRDGSVSARREEDSSSSCWTGSRMTCQAGLT